MAIRRALAVLALCLGMAATGSTGANAAEAQCKLSVIGELPVVMKGFRALLGMKIEGQEVFFFVDTGATTSLVSRSLTERLGLKPRNVSGVRVFGIGGEIEEVQTVGFDEISIGQFRSRNVTLMVTPRGRDFGPDIAGLIGQDFLGAYDVEFDLAKGVIRLMKAEGCAKANLAYWSADHAEADFMQDGGKGGHLRANVEVNGQKVRATFDTGAPLSILDLAAAQRAGLTVDSAGAQHEGAAGGLGEGEFEQYMVPVKSFGLGSQTVQNTRLRIGHLAVNAAEEAETGSHIRTRVSEVPEMLIGADFFLTHRIYFSPGRRRMFFTHNGVGGVFARPMASPAGGAMAAD